jgi:hypothetical protein
MSREYPTKEVAEAAVLYMRGFKIVGYQDRNWIFQDNEEEEIRKKIRLEVINRNVQVEPLDFMEAVRRVKAFANSNAQK